MKHRLALCTVHKDEESYLPEWICYHLNVGVEHFYIYDNNSAAPTAEALRPFIDRGLVTVTPIAAFPSLLLSYNDCLARFGPSCRWIGFCDCDEFFVPKRDRHGACHWLPQILEDYEAHGGLVVNWMEFGSSGLLTRPEGLQLEAFRRCRISDVVKTIAQPARISEALQSHFMGYRAPHHAVNEHHEACPAGRNPPWADGVQPPWVDENVRRMMNKIQLNHYFLRSRAEYEQKMLRGAHDGGRIDNPLRIAWWEESEKLYTETDDAIVRHAGATRELMEHVLRGAASDHPLLGDLARREPHIGWRLATTDRAWCGRLGGTALVLRADRALAVVALGGGAHGPRVLCRHDLWAGDCALRAAGDVLCADVDGDGVDELVLHGEGRLGVVALREGRLRGTAATLELGGDAQVLAADLDGDGAHELLRRGAGEIAVWRLAGGALTRAAAAEGRVGDWALGGAEVALVGRFSRGDRDEIVLRAPDAIGLAALRDGALELLGMTRSRVDTWWLGAADRHCIGDFDGDGLDEVYVRSAVWAAVLKWRDGRFVELWSQGDWLEPRGEGAPLALWPTDREVAVRLSSGRAGLLHCGEAGLALLSFEDAALRVRARLAGAAPWSEASGRLCPVGPLPVSWAGAHEDRQPLAIFHGDGGLAVLEHRRAGPERLALRFLSPAALLFSEG